MLISNVPQINPDELDSGFYARSADGVTHGDLNPEDFDGNHPDSQDFQMPSHEELREKYHPFKAAASEIVESFTDVSGEDNSLSNKHG